MAERITPPPAPMVAPNGAAGPAGAAGVLRRLLLYLSRAGWARDVITHFPLARRMSRRFVAGDTPDDAIAAVRALNARGILATLDHLGESVTNEAEAARAADDYLHVLDRIHQAGVRSNVSLKLTQMGLDLSEAFCLENVRRVVAKAHSLGNFVRIDMESSEYTNRTLAVFRALRQAYDNVGVVLQAYLYRTEADLLALVDEGARLRLCKGAYLEPADRAFPLKADVDANYVQLARLMLDRAHRASPADSAGRWPPLPAIATHDEKMIAAVKEYAAAIRLPREYFEFQMLYGIRRDLQEQLAAAGYAVRVYVPYGTQWYPYYMRRLAERPANLWFVIAGTVRG